ncbi:ankyrin repeat domain-containing protein 50-like [Physella acuta]|uniref:ankyrin repeat domain-containing protein 50-like n=1 Tax=Physella acuta TaxID=109671 RepID=UPI0027DE5A18|nr:ankyrin repeat domain-containing protein 50-like [Physella acuta]XP_059155837.1 ankyrin repeat domain-containing protein 50-like [Physella acuta]
MATVDAHNLNEHLGALYMEDISLDFILKGTLGLSTSDNSKMSKLSSACFDCNIKLVKTLLEQGADVNLPGDDGMTPLHVLCNSMKTSHNRLQIAELLLKKGVDVNLRDATGSTPLLLACKNNQIGLVDLLIQAGCNVNIPDENFDTPFMVACRMASEGWYFWNTDFLNDDSDTEDSYHDDKFPPVFICKSLLRAGADPKQATLLPTAVLYSTLETVKEFIDLGMDVNMKDENRRSPLGCACSTSCSISMVKLLLEKGADVNGDGRKNKPIISAYVYNSVDKIRLLLSYGASVSCEELSELFSISLTKWVLENPDIISEDSKELLSWKLLMKAGFRPTFSLIAPKLKHVSLCSSYTKVSPWINNLLSPMSSLADSCRVTIRAQLKPSVDEKIDHLPLPNSIKGFLRFSEFSNTVFRRSSMRTEEKFSV